MLFVKSVSFLHNEKVLKFSRLSLPVARKDQGGGTGHVPRFQFF